jgi:putative iron-dependent peroxidase
MEPGPHADRMSEPEAGPTSPALAQAVSAPLTRAAIFLVATLNPGSDHRATLRSFCGELAALVRAVEFRDLEGGLSCVVGFGSDAWDRLFGPPRPAELHPFREIRAGARHAVSTPGDLLFHIRAKRMDLCFELATQFMARVGNAISTVDEVQGFRYFDDRDLIGFVDGTENPRGAAVADAVLIGDEDAAFAAGSYVIVQKYLHDVSAWNALSTEAQERIIGRTKLSDIELDDSVKPTSAHNALTTIVENGKEIKILRDNMPFGRPAHGEFGTYFIGYSRSPRTIEQMLENMFVGRPPGNYDRLLDFSRAVTGNLFFVPSATFLENVPEDRAAEDRAAEDRANEDRTNEDRTNENPPTVAKSPAAPAVAEASLSLSSPTVSDGSLGIGSLKGDIRHE